MSNVTKARRLKNATEPTPQTLGPQCDRNITLTNIGNDKGHITATVTVISTLHDRHGDPAPLQRHHGRVLQHQPPPAAPGLRSRVRSQVTEDISVS